MAAITRPTLKEALTFDDVLLLPGHSEVMPGSGRHQDPADPRHHLNVPIISSAMDTVTEARLAIAMAQAGGIGVIHRNLDADEQAEEVRKVKRYESGMVVNPITIYPDETLADALALMRRHGISGIPVVERGAERQAGEALSAFSPIATSASPIIPLQPVSELMTQEAHHREGRRRARTRRARLLHQHRSKSCSSSTRISAASA